MSVAAFLFVITLASFVVTSITASFPHCISCPCGSTNQNYTQCIDKSLLKKLTCERWSHCQTCKANTTFCITCPQDRSGPTCTKISGEQIRRKRQDGSNFLNYPRQSGSCPFLEQPDSGSIRCSQTGNDRSCTAQCLPGYHFEGTKDVNEMTLRCQGGIWRPQAFFPLCKPGGQCEVKVTGAGSYNCTIDMDGTHCDVMCDGYPQGRFHCYPGRQWQPPLPYCTAPKEQVACHCQNGGVCDSNGRCTCPEGRTGTYCENLERQRATCPDPGIPRGGSRLNTDGSDASYPRTFEEGESVIFSCNGDGFALQGTSFITCLADGTWSANRSQCVRASGGPNVFCPDPGYVQFGSRVNADGSNIRRSSRFTSGHSVVFYCQEGYALVGHSLLTCLPSGRWSSNRPICRRINVQPTSPRPTVVRDPPSETSCRHPGVDLNGIIEDHPLLDNQRRGQTFPPGTELRFRCNEGYTAEGPTILMCQSSGEWTSAPPTCGRISTTTTQRPTTQGICRHPGVDVNGRIEGDPVNPRERRRTFPVGSTLTFSCNEGFEPEGPTEIRCLNSGAWSLNPPSCRIISEDPVDEPSDLTLACSVPREDPNVEIEEYTLLDPRKLQAFGPGQELNFRCREGYELEGTSTIRCLENGEWSGLIPTCNFRARIPVAECPVPVVDPNGIVEEFLLIPQRYRQRFEPGAELHFTCRDGYDLEGSSTIQCQENGQWSSLSPTCSSRARNPVPVDEECLAPEVDPNGIVDEFLLDPRKSTQSFERGTELTFRCQSGYVLEGWSTITCGSNGRWSSPSPRCNIRTDTSVDISSQTYCEKPHPIPNGRVFVFRPPFETGQPPVSEDDFDFPFGTMLKYTCNDGFSLLGADSMSCEANSYWSGSVPMCVEGRL